jgi:hypothetical protein
VGEVGPGFGGEGFAGLVAGEGCVDGEDFEGAVCGMRVSYADLFFARRALFLFSPFPFSFTEGECLPQSYECERKSQQ